MSVRIIFVVCLLFLFSCGEKKPSPQVNKKAELVKNSIEVSGLVIQANMVSVSNATQVSGLDNNSIIKNKYP